VTAPTLDTVGAYPSFECIDRAGIVRRAHEHDPRDRLRRCFWCGAVDQRPAMRARAVYARRSTSRSARPAR
jgi:hypothetical protein